MDVFKVEMWRILQRFLRDVSNRKIDKIYKFGQWRASWIIQSRLSKLMPQQFAFDINVAKEQQLATQKLFVPKSLMDLCVAILVSETVLEINQKHGVFINSLHLKVYDLFRDWSYEVERKVCAAQKNHQCMAIHILFGGLTSHITNLEKSGFICRKQIQFMIQQCGDYYLVVSVLEQLNSQYKLSIQLVGQNFNFYSGLKLQIGKI